MDGLTRPDAESPPKDPDLEPQAGANDPSVVVTLEPAAPQGPGAVLRREREARGYTIDSVAEALKLAPRQVEAIEADDFDALRGQTFARGFVKNYARLLQLDPEPLVARIRSTAPQARVVLEPRSNVAAGVPLASTSSGPVVAGGLAVAALVVVALVGTSAGWLGGDPALRKDASAPAPGSVLSDNTSAALNTPPPVSPLASSLPDGSAAAQGASASVANEPAGSSVAVTSTLATSVAGAATPAVPAGKTDKQALSVVSTAAPAPAQAAPLSATPAAPRATSASVPSAPASARPTSASGGPATTSVTMAAARPASSVATPAGSPAAATATSGAASAAAATSSATQAQPARRTSATVLSFATGKPVTVTEAPPTAAAPRAVSGTSGAQPSASATPGRGERRLSFNFDQEAWVEVKDAEGKVVFSQLSPAGSARTVSGKGPLTFVVGNAHHVKLRVDDKPFDLKPHIGVTVARFSVE